MRHARSTFHKEAARLNGVLSEPLDPVARRMLDILLREAYRNGMRFLSGFDDKRHQIEKYSKKLAKDQRELRKYLKTYGKAPRSTITGRVLQAQDGSRLRAAADDIHVRPTPDMSQAAPRRPAYFLSTPEVGKVISERPVQVPLKGGPALPTISGFIPNNGGPVITRETIMAAAKGGRKIDAIKDYRALTGHGLRESKEAVEKFMETGTLP